MDQTEKLRELLNDKEFVEKALKLESAEEVSNLFAENDVDIAPEELAKVKELVAKKVNGELTDEELAEVAGGVICETAILVFAIVSLVATGSLISWAVGW